MALFENYADIYQEQLQNPYSFNPTSEAVLAKTKRLLEERQALMTSDEFPEMNTGSENFSVYMLDGTDEYADIARSIEGAVMSYKWGFTHDEIRESSQPYENNTYFFLVVDKSDEANPRPAVALSVADCLRGPSETVHRYLSEFGELRMPVELGVSGEDKIQGLWDIMSVMRLKEYAGTTATPWAYSALHQASQLFGVKRWIASMTDEEYAMLGALGVPFTIVDDTKRQKLATHQGKDIWFGFHTVNVDAIPESMSRTIVFYDELAKDNPDVAKISTIARIALNGCK